MSIIAPQTFRCGDDWDFCATLNDASGNPLPLTGATITWKLDSLDLSMNILTLTLGNGVTITNSSTGMVAYGPTGAQTANITPGSYYNTLKVVLSAGNGGGSYTPIEGIINAAPLPT